MVVVSTVYGIETLGLYLVKEPRKEPFFNPFPNDKF